MIQDTLFHEIDQLHSEWRKMDNSSKLVWLTREKLLLDGLSNQFAQYLRLRGGFSNDEERAYGCKLLEMADAINSEGQKTIHNMANEALKELLITWQAHT